MRKDGLRELFQYRDLLYMIAYRDIKVRYTQTIMGLLWAMLMPVLIFASGILVRYAYGLAAHKGLHTADLASVAVKSLPWAFWVSSIRFSCNSLIQNRNLVTKVYFPKEIFPIAAVLACLFDLFVASGVLVVFLAAIQSGWSPYLLWVPLLLMAMVLLTLGVGMIVSAASLFFRDVKFIVELLLTFGIFFTPVLYEVSMLGDKGTWLLINPIAPILDGLAACITWHQSPNLAWFAYSFLFSVVSFVGGYTFFKHLEPSFAESI